MRKYLISLAILLVSFIGVVKVGAATDKGILTINRTKFENLIGSFDDITSESDDNFYNTGYELIKNKMNVDTDTEDYIIYSVPNYNQIYGYKWTKTAKEKFAFYPSLDAYFYSNNGYLSLSAYVTDTINITFYKWNKGDTVATQEARTASTSGVSGGYWTMKNLQSGKVTLTDTNVYTFSSYTYSYTYYIESSFDIAFKYNTLYSKNSFFSTLRIDDTDNGVCYDFNDGDVIIKANGNLSIEEEQKATITKIKDLTVDDTVVGEVIKTEVTILDDTKYNYFYKFNNDDWTQITSENFIDNYTTTTMKKNGTYYFKIEDKDGNFVYAVTYTTDKIVTPTVDYDISIAEDVYKEENKKVYNITLTYKYMTDEYYTLYYNLKDGTTKEIARGYIDTYTINYVNDDAILTVYIYSNDNEMVYYTTIDLSMIDADLEEPYVFIMGYDQNNLPNSVAYRYVNASDDTNVCYYKFGGGTLTQESCSYDEIKLRNASYNTSLSMYIYDLNNNLLHSKSVNLNFITGYPRLEFETYYNETTKAQILNVNFYDYQQDTDTLFYSTDNTNWTQLATQDLNVLTFYQDTDVYFLIYRNGEKIADSYYHVKLGSYSVSISENNTKEEIEELTGSTTQTTTSFLNSITEYVTSFSDVLTYFYNSLNGTIQNFLIAIFTTILICTIVLIARGRQ